jgi:hypothetical protein
MVDGRLIKVDIDAQRQRAVGWSDWMTCKECGQVVKLTRTMNKCHSNTSCPHSREPAASLMAAPERSSSPRDESVRIGGLGIDVHQDFTSWSNRRAGATPSRRSVLGRYCSCTGRPNSREIEAKCMPSMKRVGLVLRCNAN